MSNTTSITTPVLDDETVAAFERDGVVVLRQVFNPWIDELAKGVEQLMADPSPLERSVQPSDGSAPFFQDLCNWPRIPSFRNFIYHSPAGALAARIMGSSSARRETRKLAFSPISMLESNALRSTPILLASASTL